MTDDELLADLEKSMGRRRRLDWQLTIDQDFMVGVAAFLLIVGALACVTLLIYRGMEGSDHRREMRVDTCQDIENPAERTLCLDS